MDLQDVTRNQHFVSQSEQKLNAIDPLEKSNKKRIYSFSVEDRESYTVSLDQENGCKILKTLSINDLFSFDVLEGEASRYNFEKLFHRYENDIRLNTESLLSKLPVPGSDIKPEILNLFLSKFVNFIRNPYSVQKVLNTFPALRDHKPTDPVHRANFNRVLSGRNPKQESLCRELGITDVEYRHWLATIFMLLTPLKDGHPILVESLVKGLYENPETGVQVIVSTYSDKTCLLSDRGYSLPLADDKSLAFDFNLCSKGFIRYGFADRNSLIPDGIKKELVESYKKLIKETPKKVLVHHLTDDLELLDQYNKNVVYQCHEKVFNASLECYGAL